MNVIMQIEVSGGRDGAPWPQAGGLLEVSDAEGAELVTQGYAVPAPTPVKVLRRKVETATAPARAEAR